MAHGSGENPNPVEQPGPGVVTGWGDEPTSSTSAAWGDSWAGATGNNVQPRRWNTESPIRWELDDSDDQEMDADSGPATMTEAEASTTCLARRVPVDTYEQDTRKYTKAAVDQLLHSPEYLRHTTRCHLCWCVWAEQQFSPSCDECGGFTMQRPCLICKGKCGKIWDRDVETSHSEHKASWEGECGLPADERVGYMQLLLAEYIEEEDVLEAFEDLNTG